MFLPIIATCLLVKTTLASDSYFSGGDTSGWQAIAGPSSYETGGHQDLNTAASAYLHESLGNAHQDLNSYGSYGTGGEIGHSGIGGGLTGGHVQHHYAQAIPISQHIEVTKPVAVPVYKDVGVPVAQPVAIPVPHPVAIGVSQPYPVHVPYAQPVAIPVVKTIAIPIEKKVPYPVEKIIPVPVEKHVPVPVEKYIPVPVEKPYPIHIPVYKHVFHRSKSYGHGWNR